MALPSIAIINFSSLDDQPVQDAVRAVNRQVTEDFMPIWGAGRPLKLHAARFDPANSGSLAEEAVEADSVIYLVNESTLPGALGFHDMNTREVPIGFVFVQAGDWTITLSHEVLELIIDPTVNIFIPGPDPRDPTNPNKWLLHTYEVCDAVERSSYEIDHVPVSNFLTPNYFREGDALGTRNDFLGVGVTSFGVTAGSHLGVIDPATGNFETILGSLEMQGVLPTPCQRRSEFFDREKPERPDEKLDAILCSYNEKPAKGCKGLRHMEGISRTSRYKAAAARYKS